MTRIFPRTPHLDGTDIEGKRRELLAYFHSSFDLYESLFKLLACDEAYFRKPISLRHPLIFYFGHTATFFINKMILAGLVKERVDPRLEAMFAVGVDEMSWDDLDETRYDWPAPAEVAAYRNKVRAVVDQVIRQTPLVLPIVWQDPLWVLLMGIEHERIHLETSSVLIRQQALALVRPDPDWPPCRESGTPPENRLLTIPAGQVSLGRPFDEPIYGWDNEYGQHQVDLPAFQVSQYLVSNHEFRGFVEAGGYKDNSLWDEEGLGWVRFASPSHPSFWVPGEEGWKLRLLAEEVPMPWDWPVETNCLEARAFCRWKARETGLPVRLPSEDEWNRLYDYAELADPSPDQRASANLHLDHWASSCPVTRFAHSELYDVVGNVWQWCDTPTYPFDGFAVHPLYDDFTTPTFDDRHNIIKGGSWISLGNESRRAARYAFRRHFFQHAGFRYLVGDAVAPVTGSVYETDALLAQYAEFHYGDEMFGVPNFPKALADIAIAAHKHFGNGRFESALDLGCATGRASFELARAFDRITGIDFSARFIQCGVKLAESGSLCYSMADEGELVTTHQRRLSDLGLAEAAKKVAFWQGDACNLKDVFTGFDLILAANLIDRLYSPRKFLLEIGKRLNAGGLLVLASPYTWLEDFTKRSEWIGGFKRNGESFTTLDGLKELLSPSFDLVDGPRQIPFVIRETKRKYQHSLSEVTIWKQRA
ncbi:MAG TPA: 5-histidylcysteine sulfoxide synthase [Rhodospirillaceae bacterium]|nr:5-histidylcysteine sulfoxide synthase [Rhodospirillaceae bacterium]